MFLDGLRVQLVPQTVTAILFGTWPFLQRFSSLFLPVTWALGTYVITQSLLSLMPRDARGRASKSAESKSSRDALAAKSGAVSPTAGGAGLPSSRGARGADTATTQGGGPGRAPDSSVVPSVGS